jgi:hypothetical protein
MSRIAVVVRVLGLVDAVEQGVVDLVHHRGKRPHQVLDRELLTIVQDRARVTLAPVLPRRPVLGHVDDFFLFHDLLNDALV